MKEYEYRKTVFYQLNSHRDFEDSHKNFNYIINTNTTVDDAVKYLIDGSAYLSFPGAARAVAIAAGVFIAQNFKEEFHQILDNKNLMHGNDPYFKRYSEDKNTYDRVLKIVGIDSINWTSYRMMITTRLLKEEYMLDIEGLKLLPRKEWKSLQIS